jgi:hypothetical protein
MPSSRKRQAIYLPNGHILIPVGKEESADGWVEIGEKHPDYQHWLRVAGKEEDPRPRKER